MPSRVLIVEDNADMREALTSFLEANGFEVTAVDSTESGIDEVDEKSFAIGLVDINLPGKSGFSMIEYIRSEGHVFPLIAMTARDGLQDKLTGFGLGLTDYITKPFDLEELLARMLAQLRQTIAGPAGGQITTSNYELNPETWEFRVNGQEVTLTKIEFRLMQILMLHNKTMVKTDDIVEFVWGDSADALNPPIRIHIANLRKKIGDNDFSIIKTIPGIGYKLNDIAG